MDTPLKTRAKTSDKPAHTPQPAHRDHGAGAIAKGMDMRHHGGAELRGLNAPHSRAYASGRFGRLFPLLPRFSPDPQALIALGRAGGPMDAKDPPPPAPANAPDNPTITAGFTFLGQFVDHDITFDPTSSLERQSDPEAVTNFRTPSLELDNVYGAGPGASPHLYQRASRGGDPNKLLIGPDTDGNPNDLTRNQEDAALIGDPRNDENLIVSQLHLAVLKFHNAVVDDVKSDPPIGRSIFEEAQRLVRWHYQWMLVHEFLPLICGKEVVEDVLEHGRKFYNWRNDPFIPVEFSVAAYRFGHSQVRPGYRISANFAAPIFAAAPSAPPAEPNDLSGGRRILPRQVIDWKNFFALGGTPQQSKAIDTKISSPLLDLPFPSGAPGDPKSLATRNLLRHLTFGLPSGQAVAEAMCEGILEPDELEDLAPLSLDFETPLWFYILKEAELRAGGRHLGPVGGRIVAEVLIGLLEGDRQSYLRAHRRWKPLYGTGGDFTMVDLLKKAGVA
jgi:hypothetical protein